jgi:hypothetical protein
VHLVAFVNIWNMIGSNESPIICGQVLENPLSLGLQEILRDLLIN